MVLLGILSGVCWCPCRVSRLLNSPRLVFFSSLCVFLGIRFVVRMAVQRACCSCLFGQLVVLNLWIRVASLVALWFRVVGTFMTLVFGAIV